MVLYISCRDQTEEWERALRAIELFNKMDTDGSGILTALIMVHLNADVLSCLGTIELPEVREMLKQLNVPNYEEMAENLSWADMLILI